jgi:hypothetical protein
LVVPGAEELSDEEPADAPEDSAFLARFDFFAFFLCLVPLVPVSLADAPELAAGFSLVAPEVVPVVPVVPVAPEVLGLVAEVPEEVSGVVDDPEVLPVVPVVVPVVDEPAAPVPVVPDAPEVSLEPDAPEDGMALLPEEPLDGVLGVALEAPLPPVMPLSLPVAFCEREVEEGDVALLPVPPVVWASAMEDTDAIITNDSERSVFFNVMSNSF